MSASYICFYHTYHTYHTYHAYHTYYNGTWGLEIDEYVRRLGARPERLNNLHFAYLTVQPTAIVGTVALCHSMRTRLTFLTDRAIVLALWPTLAALGLQHRFTYYGHTILTMRADRTYYGSTTRMSLPAAGAACARALRGTSV